MVSRRGGWTAVAALAVLVVVSSVVGVPASAQGPEEPYLLADPDTGLVDGQWIEVRGVGFYGRPRIELIQCGPGATTTGDCDSSTLVYAVIYVGSIASPTPFKVASEISTTASGSVDCRQTDCVLGAVDGGNVLAAIALDFDPAGPGRGPGTSMSVEPSTGLVHGQTVTVTGEGFGLDGVYVSQCFGEPPFDPRTHCGEVTTVQPDAVLSPGSFSTALQVGIIVYPESGESHDCTIANDCIVGAADIRYWSAVSSGVEPPAGSYASVPISFAEPEPEPVQPETPSTLPAPAVPVQPSFTG